MEESELEELLKELPDKEKYEKFINLLLDGKINVDSLDKFLDKFLDSIYWQIFSDIAAAHRKDDYLKKLVEFSKKSKNLKLIYLAQGLWTHQVNHYNHDLTEAAADLGDLYSLKHIIINYTSSYKKEKIIEYCQKILTMDENSKSAINCLIETNYKCKKTSNCYMCDKAIRIYEGKIGIKKLYSIYSQCPSLKQSDKYVEVICQYHKKYHSLSPNWFETTEWLFSKKYNKLEENYEQLKKENDDLKKENEDLKNHLKYMPDGDGYIEAKEHFDSLNKN